MGEDANNNNCEDVVTVVAKKADTAGTTSAKAPPIVRECDKLDIVISDIGESYQSYRFEASIKHILNCVGAKLNNSSSICYIVLNLNKPVLGIPKDYKDNSTKS